LATADGPDSGVDIIQPTNLGLADIGYRVINASPNDIGVAPLAPVLASSHGDIGDPPVPAFNSTAIIGGRGKAESTAYQSIYPKNPNVASFGTTDPGDTEPGVVAVGNTFPIFQGNASGSGTSTSAQVALTAFAPTTVEFGEPVLNPHNATLAFDTLSYRADFNGTVALQPAVNPTATEYWKNTQRGNTSTIPSQYTPTYFSSADTINPLPVLTINVSQFTPPPPAISLTSAPISAYGPSLGKLTVSGQNGDYTVAQIFGFSDSSGTVEVAGFNPANDTEIYALDVQLYGSQLTPAQIADVIAYIDSTGGLASDPMVSSSLSRDPFPANYNVFITAPFPLTRTGDNYLGFYFPVDASDPPYTVAAVAVVPEPLSFATLTLGLLAGLRRRQGHPTNACPPRELAPTSS
jgi:hypothetical protein